jgi:quercetin dioxygenase-like cupin family protein
MNEADIVKELEAEGFDKVYVWAAEPGEEDPEHTHPFDTRLVVIEGDIRITMNGDVHTLSPGESFDIPHDMPHEGHAGMKGCRYAVAEKHYGK